MTIDVIIIIAVASCFGRSPSEFMVSMMDSRGRGRMEDAGSFVESYLTRSITQNEDDQISVNKRKIRIPLVSIVRVTMISPDSMKTVATNGTPRL